jgi:hypothetical protein
MKYLEESSRLHAPLALPPGGGWVGFKAGLDDVNEGIPTVFSLTRSNDVVASRLPAIQPRFSVRSLGV